jgi:hypothetical protein
MQLWLVLSCLNSCVVVGNEIDHTENCMCMLRLRFWTVVCSGMWWVAQSICIILSVYKLLFPNNGSNSHFCI